MDRTLCPRLFLLLSLSLGTLLLATGCGGGSSSTVAQFTASATAAAPGLVKLVPKTTSGSRAVVDVLIFGPEPNLDLLGFEFGVKIGDTNLVRFVPQAMYVQNALVPDEGQTVAADVDGVSDPSVVKITVTKNGGGAGNGFAGASAVVIELSFDVQGSGATTLSIVGPGAGEPEALDSHRNPIAAVRFDAASGGLRGVTTGGGGY
jgi:hypothetical protein